MECAARSAPQARSAPRSRARMSFVPTESVEAARYVSPSSGYSPANAPNPRAPVDSTAARRRSTTASAFAIETPAASYVCSPPTGRAYSPADGRAVAADELDARASPARADRAHRRRIRRSRPYARATGPASAGLAHRALLARHRAARDRGRIADCRDRRDGALLVPHDAAPADRG